METSDEALKMEIEELKDALNIVESLKGYYYKWKTGHHKSKVIGFIAQEMNEKFPEVSK